MSAILCFILFIFLQMLPSAAQEDPRPNDESLLWGPYRPNLYLGIRPRISHSLLMGLMWSSLDDPSGIPNNLRHTCEQDEGMVGYGWVSYDVRGGGTQIINDTENQIDLTTHFLKLSDENHSQGWGLRVRGEVRVGTNEDQKTTVIFYLGNEDSSSETRCKDQQTLNETSSVSVCEGTAIGLGAFKVQVLNSQEVNQALPTVSIKSLNVSIEDIWKAKSIFTDKLRNKKVADAKVTNPTEAGNLHFVQQTFEGNFEFDVVFSSNPTSQSISSDEFTNEIQATLIEFNDRFNSVYSPQSPFEDELHVKFSQSLLSNLMGGIGFFYGTSKIDLSSMPEPATQEQGPHQLFSSVPSRPFFPRGFLWDEGFHLQVILEWDMDLALDIVLSWFDLMDENGWIAREQILGHEAKSKVPSEFQTQHQHYANPPTLFLVVQAFHARLTKQSHYSGNPSRYLDNPDIGKAFLRNIFSKMKKHYEWFCRTQAGDTTDYGEFDQGYRWRGRTAQHILTSGLDDYPRAQPPHLKELHVDALCWVGLMDSVLMKLSIFLSEKKDHKAFSKHKSNVIRSFDGIHWSDLDQTYCDTTVVNGDQVEKVCHKGYISLFPFLTGLMNSSHPHIGAMLDLIRDPEELWSPYGLRSLSRKDKYYGTDENYWRSPIWININYMALENLLGLAQQPGPYQQKARGIYTELRLNLVSTVFNSWKTTGFAWEQYNPETGRGQRTQHFTGWTSLIVRIMAMPDLTSGHLPHMPADGAETFPIGAWNKKLALAVIAFLMLTCFIFRRRLRRLCSGLWKGDKDCVR